MTAVGKPCAYCGEAMIQPTRDHVHPRRAGGTLHPENVLIVCYQCNQDKGAKTLERFAQSLTWRQDPRAPRVWALVEARPSWAVTDVKGWEKARRNMQKIAQRARIGGQE